MWRTETQFPCAATQSLLGTIATSGTVLKMLPAAGYEVAIALLVFQFSDP